MNQFIYEREAAAPSFPRYQLRLSVMLWLLGNHRSALCSVPEVKGDNEFDAGGIKVPVTKHNYHSEMKKHY